MAHMDAEDQDTKSSRIGKSILEKFSILAESNDSDRIKATDELLNLIQDKQNSFTQDGQCPDLQYVLWRLVRGLASSRKFARLGYSLALCQILRKFDVISVEDVLKAVQENLKQQPHSQNKSEIGNVLLGKTFAFLTLINSGRMLNGKDKQVQFIVKQLMSMRSGRSYLHQLCVSGVVELIKQIETPVFWKTVWPEVAMEFSSGWGDCTPDALLMLLHADKHHHSKVKKFLKENWAHCALVAEKNYPNLADIVKKSTSVHPLIHPVNQEIVQVLVERKLDFASFWKTVIRPLFQGSAAKKNLAMFYFLQLLPNVQTPDQLEEILSQDIAHFVSNLQAFKSEEVTVKGKEIKEELKKFVKTCTDPSMQLTVIKCLIAKQGPVSFQKKTGTNLLSTLILDLLPEAVVMFSRDVMEAGIGGENWILADKDNHPVRKWCITQLSGLVTHSGIEHTPTQLHVLQYLCLHGFFVLKKIDKNIPQCKQLPWLGTDSFSEHVRTNFFKAINRLVSVHSTGQTKSVQFSQRLDLMYSVVEYIQELLSHPDVAELENALNPELMEEWTNLKTTVQTVNKKRKREEKVGESHAFELLFLYLGLQLFHEPAEALEVLQDLHVCYQKSTQRKKKATKKADDEPQWIEVIVELLLSMMAKRSSLARVVADSVFSGVTSHVTPEAVNLIVNVLQQNKDEDGPVGFEDEDEDMEDDEEEESDMKEEDKDSSEKEEESDSDDSRSESEDESEAVDETFRQSVKAALGDAAVSSEEEGDSEEEGEDVDMSDSEMFKLDDALSKAFKMMKKNKTKDSKEQAKHMAEFKLRVLDFVEILIKNNPTASKVKELIFPLLDMIDEGQKKKEDRALGNRAEALFNMLYKIRKIPPDADVGSDELLEMVKNLVQFSTKVPDVPLTKEAAKGCLIIIRLLLKVESTSEPSPLKTRSQAAAAKSEHKTTAEQDIERCQAEVVKIIQSALEDFIHRRSHINPVFFNTLLSRYPLMFWPLSEQLVLASMEENVKVFHKTQACALLCCMVNKRVAKEIGEEPWKKFLDSFHMCLSQVLKQQQGNIKPMFVQKLLEVISHILAVSHDDCREVVKGEVMVHLVELKVGHNKDLQKIHQRIVAQLSNYKRKEKKERKRKKQMSGGENEASSIDGGDTLTHSPNKQRKSEQPGSGLMEGNAGEAVTNVNGLGCLHDIGSSETKEQLTSQENSKHLDTSACNIDASASNGILSSGKKKHKRRKSQEVTQSSLKGQIEGTVSSQDNNSNPSLKKKKKKESGN